VAIRDLSRHQGQTVALQGWLYGRRSGGKVVFLLVRDGTGICQCVAEAGLGGIFETAATLPQESAVRVGGLVRADARSPGGFELAVQSLEVLHRAEEYPLTRKAHGVEFLMEHRHLWFRSPRQSAILRIRHTLVKALRDFFDARGFTLIDTPILVPAAGEDAQTLFPVDYFGEPAFLAQTGQLYVETACMALGKVYCFGPTFRAEKSKTRRHLTEFWMIEPEVAFADMDDAIELATAMICYLVQAVLERHADDLRLVGRNIEALRKIAPPFPRMTYTEAADLLRSPALRQRLEAESEADRARLQTLIGELDRLQAERSSVRQQAKSDALDAAIRERRELIAEVEQDVAAWPEHIALAQAFAWGKDLGGSDETILARQFDKPLFVTEYPRAAKAFYMKVAPGDPRLVRNFDLLAPEGYGEIIGGSQREDDLATLQESIRLKGLRAEDYGWYLDLRRYGSVPHAGFGLGVERTLAWICGLKHVRETIPFPRLMGKIYP
jgi:asparaginyl-tRNA synthetase